MRLPNTCAAIHSASRSCPEFFARKRDLFCGLLEGSGFRWTPAQGTYFQLLDFSALSDEDDMIFADRLLREAGVATIPLAPFYQDPPKLARLRFCFAKRDETLRAGSRAPAPLVRTMRAFRHFSPAKRR